MRSQSVHQRGEWLLGLLLVSILCGCDNPIHTPLGGGFETVLSDRGIDGGGNMQLCLNANGKSEVIWPFVIIGHGGPIATNHMALFVAGILDDSHDAKRNPRIMLAEKAGHPVDITEAVFLKTSIPANDKMVPYRPRDFKIETDAVQFEFSKSIIDKRDSRPFVLTAKIGFEELKDIASKIRQTGKLSTYGKFKYYVP